MKRLPKIVQPKFKLTVPSTKEIVEYTPFTVKEEKILLIAQESKDIDQIITAIKQIINNCVINIDVEKLALFDIEYIFMLIRAKSINDVIEFSIKDPTTHEDVNLELDINNISIKYTEGHSDIINIADGAYLKMRYPSLNELNNILEAKTDQIKYLNIFLQCIEYLVYEDTTYNFSDYTDEEKQAFMDSLTKENINQISDFFTNMPKVSHKFKYVLKNGEEKTLVLEGLNSFFL